jgi:hypothetical protein
VATSTVPCFDVKIIRCSLFEHDANKDAMMAAKIMFFMFHDFCPDKRAALLIQR